MVERSIIDIFSPDNMILFLTLKMKSLITTSMKTPNSTLRLLFATEAYGMGTDAPDIKRVVHFGPPASLESKNNNLKLL